MTIETYKELAKSINANVDQFSKELNSLPKGGMFGLALITPEYREIKSKFDFWFKKLQDLNKTTPKSIHTQIKNEKRASWKM